MLTDIALHFISRWRYSGNGVWSCRMWRYGRPITGRGDHVLGTYRRDFYKACNREPRLSMDHRMILEELKGDRERRNRKYFKGRTTWPIVSLKRVPMQEEDVIFGDLQKEINKPTRPE